MDQITVTCPRGHRVRGPQVLQGRQVRCPKCAASFTFAVTDKKEVTDTGVMRILGDIPMPPLPPPPEPTEQTDRPCPRCERQISVTTTVCKYCSCYVGMVQSERQFNASVPHTSNSKA